MLELSSNKIYLSAWDIISCPRGVYYKKKRFPLPLVHPEIAQIRENYTRVAEIGKLIQRRLREKWIAQKVLIAAENRILNNWGLLCKFDAICKINDELILYEIKGIGEDLFEMIKQTGQPRNDNRIQVIIYHHFLSPKYPNLKPVLLYVNRKNQDEVLEVLIEYSEKDVESIHQRVLRLKESIEKGVPLEPAENIIFDPFTRKYMINPVAITCNYHGLCCGDDYWYPKAMEEVERLNHQGIIENG